MSHHHNDRVLKQLFAHPVSMNVRWADVVHLVTSLGGSAEPAHGGGREKLKLNGQERTFHVPHGGSIESRDEVVALRHFFDAAGIRPAGAEKAQT